MAIAPDEAISFLLEAGTFVLREPCTRDACSTTLRLYQPAGEMMTQEVDEGEPVMLDVSPVSYFAELEVIYETDDGDYNGGFTAAFGLIVR